MKNYLVKSVFEIQNPNWQVVDRKDESQLYQKYLDLHVISLGSYKKHLAGDWEFKFVTGKVDHVNQAFEKTFWAIHDLWHREPCNILYTDPDTLAVSPVEIFGQFDRFMMFNHTDPRTFNKNGIVFEHFFNAGVRYFPASMSKETWQLGTDAAKNWDHSTYDTEQVILNRMLWSQGISVKDAWHPELNWTAMNLRNLDTDLIRGHSLWNQYPFEQSKIIHFHSSRGAEATRQIMEMVKSSSIFSA